MRTSPSESRPRQASASVVPASSSPDSLAFLCLVGFIATQGYAIPVVALHTNWAVWPSLPDLFGLGVLFFAVLSRQASQFGVFDRAVSRRLWMLVLYSFISYVALTLTRSNTGVAAKYGGFTLIQYLKYVLVSWAASHVHLNEGRVRWIHRAALLAFLWLALTALAYRFSILDLKTFTSRLPLATSGRWGAPVLDSTVGAHSHTSLTILLLAGLNLATTDYRKRWVTTVLVIALGTTVALLSGSRQGVVRFLAFVVVLLARRGGRLLLALVFMAVLSLLLVDAWGGLSVALGSKAEHSLQRQRVLVEAPLTEQGLHGRPSIWARTVKALNERPVLYATGGGIGSYAEYGGGAHNMILNLLLEGGVIALLIYIVCYGGIFLHLWRIRGRAWAMVAVTAGMLTSLLTSEIFYPTLSGGWYLGLYFVSLHVSASTSIEPEAETEYATEVSRRPVGDGM